MRLFAIALLLILLVANVVIGQRFSLLIEQPISRVETNLQATDSFKYADSHTGYKSYFYSYAKADQSTALRNHEYLKLNAGADLMRSIARVYGYPDCKPSIKKLIRLAFNKLSAMVYTLYKRLDRFLQLIVRDIIFWVNRLRTNRAYILFSESNLNFFEKEYGTGLHLNLHPTPSVPV